jgi:hypothetical protein
MFDIYDGWVATTNHDTAIRVVDRTNETVSLLRLHPYMGRAAEMKDRRALVLDEYIVMTCPR